MHSKRSRQHAARRNARRIADLLSGSCDDAGNPIYRLVEQRMRSAYATIGATLAVAQYLRKDDNDAA